MPVSASVRASLERAASQLPAATLKKLFHTAGCEIGGKDGPQSSGLLDLLSASTSPEQKLVLKEAYAAACILVADMAKQNLSEESNRRLLHEFHFQENLLGDICDILRETIPPVQALASVSGLRLDRVIDVSWRLDYCLRSNTFGTIHEPLYFVVLTTQRAANGTVGYVRFTCTVAQLDELVFKLQEALEQVGMVFRAIQDENKL
ncbi:hypothetical protein ACHHYP_12453 [Achlya hypogyna]|uniref:COMM domain-containing protein 3 n=1 Tax=Achlya hypogyna TaxID=1202772 RepID=A0A1V9YGY0_ACHHY|nr:hypothetical protein ACHHYP_12453 [Achlya hypogyna]